MDDKYKFSVGIPAYKGQYLFECISSILNQSYPVFELIIVNDFSPDPIDSIIEQFSDQRIKYFKNTQNTGAEHLANNYNRCLEKATGDYFMLMGDDDKLEPDYFEEFATLISKYPNLNVFHCRSLIIDQNSNPIRYTPSWPEYESVYDNIWHRMNGYRVQFIADFVYKLSALNENNGFYYMPLGWYTDDITSYIAMKDKGIAHTNKPVLNYRNHTMNITSIGSYELKMKAILEQQNWFNHFLKFKPDNEHDLITYKNLYRSINQLMRKHKIEVISSSLGKNFLENCTKWIKKRKEFNLQLQDVISSVLMFYRIKRGAKRQ